MWLAGREILGRVQDEQLGSNFRSHSCAGKLKELWATGQARVCNRAVTGVFICLGSEGCVCSILMTFWDPMDRGWDFLGRNTGVGCYFLFQGIFLTQE